MYHVYSRRTGSMEKKRYKTHREMKGLLRFSKETISAFGMALIFIVYVVQAFRIPSGSMEDSLLIGDQLLGLKFVYGAPVVPFTHLKFPGVKDPRPGEVVIFKTPGNNGRAYIKRCVAGPGQIIEIRDRTLMVNGKKMVLPPHGKHIMNGHQGFDGIEHFAPYRIPSSGDTIRCRKLSIRDALFFKHIVHQEHPRSEVSLRLILTDDGDVANDRKLLLGLKGLLTLDEVAEFTRLDTIDNWVVLQQVAQQVLLSLEIDRSGVDLFAEVLLEGEPVGTYVVKNDNYFMLGDNRDNSLDSRYWGVVNRSFVKAQALMIYFSMDPQVPLWNLARKIRWNRFGKLIRSWERVAG
ncbi:MAG: signal peptidase I [Chitinivibrionales bacterium]|nr:signal peptidase I [Chitinivibrionales bacterium]